MKFVLILLLPVYMFSCTSNSDATTLKYPENIIDSLTFAKILTDMHIADGAAKFQVLPDNRRVTVKYGENLGVLKNYNISKAQFDSTLVYCANHPAYYDRLYSRVLDNLSQKQAELNKH